MQFTDTTLGAAARRQLQERRTAAVLTIGKDTFTRTDLAGATCFNFTAAQTLSHILQKEVPVKDTRDLFERVAPQALALPRIGVIAFAVLGTAFEVKGLGGAHPLDAWVAHHADKDAKLVTLQAIKHRATIEANLREAERDRKRRNPASRRTKRAAPTWTAVARPH